MYLTTLAQFTTRSYRALLADVESGALPARNCGTNLWLVRDEDFARYVAAHDCPLHASAYHARIPHHVASYLWACIDDDDAPATIDWNQAVLDVGLYAREHPDAPDVADRCCDVWASIPQSVLNAAHDSLSGVEVMAKDLRDAQRAQRIAQARAAE